MRSRLLLVCVLSICCASMAQTNQAWANLNRLHAGEKIEVVDAGAKKHSGTFLSVSDLAISIRKGAGRDAAGEESIAKQDVRSVKVTGNNRRLRNTLIGTGVGAGAGAGIMAGVWESHGFLGGKGDGAAFGGAFGAILGAIVGAFEPTHHTVYRVASH